MGGRGDGFSSCEPPTDFDFLRFVYLQEDGAEKMRRRDMVSPIKIVNVTAQTPDGDERPWGRFICWIHHLRLS